MKLIFVSLAVLLCGATAYPTIFDGPQCEAPNGGGIRATIREVIAMVPLEEIVEIYMVAVSNDKEVQEVMEFVQSDEFISIVKAVNGHANFHELMKFACDELYLDTYYYLNVVHEFLGWPAIERPALSNFARPGFVGLLQDVLDMVPHDKIIALMKEKIETDEYVKKAVDLMRSDKFKGIVKTVHDLPDYQFMEGELRKMGVPVEKIVEFLEKFFGWPKY